MLPTIKCVLNFSTTFIWQVSHYKKNRAGYDQKYISVLMYSTVILVTFQ